MTAAPPNSAAQKGADASIPLPRACREGPDPDPAGHGRVAHRRRHAGAEDRGSAGGGRRRTELQRIPRARARGFDVVHLFSTLQPHYTYLRLRHLKARGVPTVVSTIYWAWEPGELEAETIFRLGRAGCLRLALVNAIRPRRPTGCAIGWKRPSAALCHAGAFLRSRAAARRGRHAALHLRQRRRPAAELRDRIRLPRRPFRHDQRSRRRAERRGPGIRRGRPRGLRAEIRPFATS